MLFRASRSQLDLTSVCWPCFCLDPWEKNLGSKTSDNPIAKAFCYHAPLKVGTWYEGAWPSAIVPQLHIILDDGKYVYYRRQVDWDNLVRWKSDRELQVTTF